MLYQSYTPTVEGCRNCTKQEYLYQFIELNVFSVSETNNKDYDVTSLKLKGPIEMEKQFPCLLVESTENMFLTVETVDEKDQVYLFSCVS